MYETYKYSVILFSVFFLITCLNAQADEFFKGEKDCRVIERGEKILNNNYEKIYELSFYDDIHFASPDQLTVYQNLLYIVDYGVPGILVYSADGEFVQERAQKGKGPGEFLMPEALAISDDFIYCLDKGKLTISKFDLNLNLLWERRIPEEIIRVTQPNSISIAENSIFLSGFAYYNNPPLLWELTEDMKVSDKYLVFNHEFHGKEKIFKYMFSTGNRAVVSDNHAYVGMWTGKNILYCINLENKEIEYKIVKPTVPSNDFKVVDFEGGGWEVIMFFSVLRIKATENYIITLEECGGTSKDMKKLPKNYYNNLSFYKKDGTYLFSFQDESIPYSYSGYGFDVEEIEDGFNIYIVSEAKGCLLKYKLEYEHK